MVARGGAARGRPRAGHLPLLPHGRSQIGDPGRLHPRGHPGAPSRIRRPVGGRPGGGGAHHGTARPPGVPVELIDRMKTQLELDVVITAYGLTETHGTATICEQTDSIETIATTVGHPLDGLGVRSGNGGGVDRAVGEPGEVLVRGFNVMSEYFNAP